jgi:hypothetical protein
MNQDLLDFVWVDLVPEAIPAFPVIDLSGLATKTELAQTKTVIEGELATQTAALGAQLINSVDAEGLVNQAIRDSIESASTQLITLQTEAFGTLTTRIDNVVGQVAVVDGKVSVVDGKVGVVDSKVTAVKESTDTKFGQVDTSIVSLGASVETVDGKITTTSALVDEVADINSKQNLVLGQLVKAARNSRNVLNTLLESIN